MISLVLNTSGKKSVALQFMLNSIEILIANEDTLGACYIPSDFRERQTALFVVVFIRG
jgi:hypothetical protein